MSWPLTARKVRVTPPNRAASGRSGSVLNKRRRILAAIPMTAALALGSLIGSSTVLASGTCQGNKTEVVIAEQTQTVSDLLAYDLNGDGIVCQAVKGKKTTYSDNRL
jgi:hypothetical protein